MPIRVQLSALRSGKAWGKFDTFGLRPLGPGSPSDGDSSYKKVLGTRNPSVILTKHVASTLLEQHLLTVGAEFRGGRADSAPNLDQIQPYDESTASRVVRFSPTVLVKMIPAIGKGRPTKIHEEITMAYR